MHVLLIEDEHRVADFVRRGLTAEGWTVEHVGDGKTALERLAAGSYDIVLLDLMLPGLPGLEVLRRMRARRDVTPVLILSALAAVDERVEGLRLGADDYLPKPFDFDELVARVAAQVRRRREFAADEADGANALRVEGLCYDLDTLELHVDGEPIEVTAKERELLVLFLRNTDKVLSRERILNAVWNSAEDPLTNVVDVYVSRLRKKLGPHGPRLRTVRGAGYRLEARIRAR